MIYNKFYRTIFLLFYCQKAFQLRWTSINSDNKTFFMADPRYLFPINLKENDTSSLHYVASKPSVSGAVQIEK